jgi:hypothetical protein
MYQLVSGKCFEMTAIVINNVLWNFSYYTLFLISYLYENKFLNLYREKNFDIFFGKGPLMGKNGPKFFHNQI